MTFREQLGKMGACGPAIGWVCELDLTSAWAQCHRGDWMMWLAAEVGVDVRKMVRTACACYRLALAYTMRTEVLATLEGAELWCDGKATVEEALSSSTIRAGTSSVDYAKEPDGEGFALYAAEQIALAVYFSPDEATSRRHASDAVKFAARAVAVVSVIPSAASIMLALFADTVRQHITAEEVQEAMNKMSSF